MQVLNCSHVIPKMFIAFGGMKKPSACHGPVKRPAARAAAQKKPATNTPRTRMGPITKVKKVEIDEKSNTMSITREPITNPAWELHSRTGVTRVVHRRPSANNNPDEADACSEQSGPHVPTPTSSASSVREEPAARGFPQRPFRPEDYGGAAGIRRLNHLGIF